MKIGIMQPYFFPYLGYWQLIKVVDKYVIYDDVNYIKNGWINRNFILLNGQKHLLTLPLDGASPFELINNTRIIQNEKVKLKLLRTLSNAYSKAPFYNEIYPIVEATIMHKSLNISEALIYSIRNIVEYLDLDTEIIISSEINKKLELKAQDKVIDIVKYLEGDTYINAIGGQELYNRDDFKSDGIDLYFLKMHNISYQQLKNDFVPNLSIIDVLMFNSPEAVREMLDDYELI